MTYEVSNTLQGVISIIYIFFYFMDNKTNKIKKKKAYKLLCYSRPAVAHDGSQ